MSIHVDSFRHITKRFLKFNASHDHPHTLRDYRVVLITITATDRLDVRDWQKAATT